MDWCATGRKCARIQTGLRVTGREDVQQMPFCFLLAQWWPSMSSATTPAICKIYVAHGATKRTSLINKNCTAKSCRAQCIQRRQLPTTLSRYLQHLAKIELSASDLLMVWSRWRHYPLQVYTVLLTVSKHWDRRLFIQRKFSASLCWYPSTSCHFSSKDANHCSK